MTFKNKLKHSDLGRCKFISITHLYRESLGEKGLFRSTDTLQIADVLRLHSVLASL